MCLGELGGCACWVEEWPQSQAHPSPCACDCVTSHGKGGFVDGLTFRLLRRGDASGLLGEFSVIPRGVTTGRQEAQKRKAKQRNGEVWGGAMLPLQAGEGPEPCSVMRSILSYFRHHIVHVEVMSHGICLSLCVFLHSASGSLFPFMLV